MFLRSAFRIVTTEAAERYSLKYCRACNRAIICEQTIIIELQLPWVYWIAGSSCCLRDVISNLRPIASPASVAPESSTRASTAIP